MASGSAFGDLHEEANTVVGPQADAASATSIRTTDESRPDAA
jgi:hypothetical protein